MKAAISSFMREHRISKQGLERLILGPAQVSGYRRGQTKLYFPEFIDGEWKTRSRWVKRQFSKWNAQHLDVSGNLKWAMGSAPNLLTDEGEKYILDIVFSGEDGVDASHYIGIDDHTLAEGDSLTDLTNEPATGSYARQTVNTDATDYTVSQSGGDWRATSKTVAFTPSGATWSNMDNAFLCNVSSGTSGLLIAEVAFSTARTIADGETLNTSMYISLGE